MSDMIHDEVIVYSQPSCGQCIATYRALESKGIRYRVVDLSEHPEAVDYIQELDSRYRGAPVVVVDDQDHWSGFQPAEIDRIAQHRS
ncbi:glutaredoxin domain-containing protein [Microbacterium sp. B19]|uniref:glutaredoxin domain-containing protein n=1 Tax=Microbacterium sp. B19 TaxID=96765 RepID=UPI00034A32E4|nr:glutaredoxin domain-containing protein [Microbacterium sp. B19]